MNTIVIKLGGEVVQSEALASIASDIAALHNRGQKVVLVHGGGPQATELQKQLGQTPKMIGGRRVTDQATLDVMKMTVAGKVNVDLCAALCAAGANPVGLHGASSLTIEAKRRPPKKVPGSDELVDYGLVGDVIAVNRKLIELLLSANYTPVVACLGADRHGSLFNINADTIANQIAMAVDAEALVLVTDVPAVLRDVNNSASRIAKMSIAEGTRAIAEGVVTRGMIPKLEESFNAITAGVKSVLIVGRLAPGELLSAVEAPGSVGTLLVP